MKKDYIIIILFTITIQVIIQSRQNTSVGFHSLVLYNNGRLWEEVCNFYDQPGNETNTSQYQLQ